MLVIAGAYITVNLLLTWLATYVQRRFVGDGTRTQEIIRGVIADNVADFSMQLTKFMRK